MQNRAYILEWKNPCLLDFAKKTRKPVYLLTTPCHAEDIHVRSNNSLEGTKPVVIHRYNQYMVGVDVSDESIYHTSCVLKANV